MIRRALTIAFTAAGLSLALGCGTEEKPLAPVVDYFPLAVGNYWVYDETGYSAANPTATRQIRHEVVDYIDMDFEHDAEGALPVFVVETTYPTGDADDPRLEYHHDDGVRAVRKRQEVYDQTTAVLKKTRDYEPGLLRLDRSLTAAGEEWDEVYMTFTVSIPAEIDDGDWEVEYLYEILDPVTVTVPAGTFDDCMVVQRTTASGTDFEVKVYYFARDVGKVKEDTGDGEKVEELFEYHVETPDGGV